MINKNSHRNSKLHMIYISSNNVRHPVTNTFTTPHPTTLNSISLHFSSSHLNFTQLNLILERVNGRYVLMWACNCKRGSNVNSEHSLPSPPPSKRAFIVSRLDVVNKLVTSLCSQFARRQVNHVAKANNFPCTTYCNFPITSRRWVLMLGVNPLNPELNPICYLLALLGAHHFLHVSRIRVKSLTFRLLMSYIYMEHPFLMFLDHIQRRSTVGRTPLDE